MIGRKRLSRLFTAGLIIGVSLKTITVLSSCSSPPPLPWTYISLGSERPAFSLERALIHGRIAGQQPAQRILACPALDIPLHTESLWHKLHAGDSLSSPWNALPAPLQALFPGSNQDTIHLKISQVDIEQWRSHWQQCSDQMGWLVSEFKRTPFSQGSPGEEVNPAERFASELKQLGWSTTAPARSDAYASPLEPGTEVEVSMAVYWADGQRIGTRHTFSFTWGETDQVLPCIAQWLSRPNRSDRAELWSTSDKAFGRFGLPKIGLPADTPVRIEVRAR